MHLPPWQRHRRLGAFLLPLLLLAPAAVLPGIQQRQCAAHHEKQVQVDFKALLLLASCVVRRCAGLLSTQQPSIGARYGRAAAVRLEARQAVVQHREVGCGRGSTAMEVWQRLCKCLGRGATTQATRHTPQDGTPSRTLILHSLCGPDEGMQRRQRLGRCAIL